MRKWLILVVLVLIGLSRAPTEEETESAKAVQEVKQRAEKASGSMDKMKAQVEASKTDRNAVVQKAIEAMRKSAAERVGTEEANAAEITADQSGIKDFGEERWEVTGQYLGTDEEVKTFRTPWTARIFLGLGSLQCKSIKLGGQGVQ